MKAWLRRGVMVVCLLGTIGLVLPAEAEPVGVQAARTNDYGRIVFVWKTPVTHDLKLENQRLTVRFGRSIEASYQRVLGKLGKYVADAQPGSDGRSVTFRLRSNFDAYSFDSGRTVIVEIADTPAPQAKPQPKIEQAESSVTLVRRQVAAQEAANGTLAKIRVRTGVHSDYSRIVFDWRDAVKYDLSNNDGVVGITSRRAADLQVAGINVKPPPFVGGIRARPGDGVTRVILTVSKTSSIKHFLSGPKVVVDVRRPTGSKEISALPPEEAVPSEPAKPALEQPKTDAAPPQPAPAKVPEKAPAEPQQATMPVALQPKTDAAPAQSAPAKAPEKAPVESQQATLPVALPPTAEQASATAGETAAKSTEQQTSAEALAAGSAHVATAARSPPVVLKPFALTPGGQKKSTAKKPAEGETEDEGQSMAEPERVDPAVGVKIRFDWDEPVAAAVFRRVGFVWVAFDKASKVDTDALIQAGGTIIRGVDQAANEQSTVLRIATLKGVNPSVARDGASWILEFRKQDMRPATPIDVKAQPDSPVGARVFLPVPEPGKPIGITDPTVGDNLVVVPVIPLGHGVGEAYEYPQLALLPTGQGVVVRAKIDDLRVRPLPQGIELSARTKLAISRVSDDVAAGARLAEKKPLEKLLELEKWELKELDDFNQRKQELQAELAASRDGQREMKRMNLARFYFSNGFHTEALGVVARMETVRPEIAEEGEFRLIRGAINYFLNRLADAASDLSHASLDNNDEANFWRASVIAASGDLLAAAAELRRTGGITRGYPKALKMPMGALVAEAAIEIGDTKTAKAFIKALNAAKPNDTQQARLNFIEGKVLNMGDDPDGAIGKWEEVLESHNRPVRAQATIARMELMLKLDRMDEEEAIAELEKLRFAWRGDLLEFDLLRRLGELYLDEGIYRNGLQVLRQAATYYRDNEEAAQVTEQMADVFSGLYLRNGADEMSAVTAIAVYREFKELTPAGAKGDEMIRKLADRLAGVDLLEQAAEILEGQIRFRLSGPLKAEVGARLAVIYLLARRYDLALAALNATNESGLESELSSQRRLLRARAMMGSDQQDGAVELLKRDKEAGADMLRAEIFWKGGDWGNASKALRRVVKANGAKKGKALSEEQAAHVLNYAISMTLSGNERGLGRLRRDYGRALEATSMKDAFRLVTAPTALGLIDPASVAARVKVAENFKTFLGEYKKKLKEKGLSSLTEQTADAGVAANTEGQPAQGG